MKQYLEWLEKQIDFCLEDGTMQKEHWAFCKAYEKFKSLETTTESEELTPYIEYYDNGNVSIKGQLNSKGKREGIWEVFYENGNIHWRTPFKEDKADGIVEWFYENGNIHLRTSYKEGNKDGIEEWFYENGNIRRRTPYKNGMEDGIEERFYSNPGNIIKTRLWKNGELIKTTKH